MQRETTDAWKYVIDSVHEKGQNLWTVASPDMKLIAWNQFLAMRVAWRIKKLAITKRKTVGNDGAKGQNVSQRARFTETPNRELSC